VNQPRLFDTAGATEADIIAEVDSWPRPFARSVLFLLLERMTANDGPLRPIAWQYDLPDGSRLTVEGVTRRRA